MAHKVFICHAAEDRLVADAVCAALEARRISCWIAPRDLLRQSEPMAEVAESIATCTIVVILFSVQAYDSPHIRFEIDWAVADEKIIVPFCVEQFHPAIALVKTRANAHWLDVLTVPMEHRLAELCGTIVRIIEQQQPAKQLWRPSDSSAGKAVPRLVVTESIPAAPLRSSPLKVRSTQSEPGKFAQRQAAWLEQRRTFKSMGAILLVLAGAGTILAWHPVARHHNPDRSAAAIVAPEANALRTIRTGIAVDSIAFSPDGRVLASGNQGIVDLWNVSTGNNIRCFEDEAVSIAFSPDGGTLASGGLKETVHLWDVATGHNLHTLKDLSLVLSVAFSPDGRMLASGNADLGIVLWDVATGRRLRTLKGHRSAAMSLAFSPDGRTLASGSADSTIKLWKVQTGANVATLRGHTDEVRSIAYSPDGRILASGSQDGTIKLWEAGTGKNTRTLLCNGGYVYSVTFSPGGRTLVSGSMDHTVKLWDIKSGRNTATLRGHAGDVYSVAFSPDGRTLASGGGDKTIKLWNVGE